MALPCDNDGVCMTCKVNPPSEDCLTCRSCGAPWHVPCLPSPIESLASTVDWECPDCSGEVVPVNGTGTGTGCGGGSGLVAAIRKIEADSSLTEAEKAKKRQKLVSGKADDVEEDEDDGDVMATLRDNVNCSICLQLPERPVTTPCGHNYCLKCFQKWVLQGKLNCTKCRGSISKKMADDPRINLTLVAAIRLARASKPAAVKTARVYHNISNQNLPDKAFTSARAVKTGKANATSGRIFVTVPSDHFGPITAEYDPTRNQGVLVGESWAYRLDCRQWGVHLPPVSGIAGQSAYGAQSVVISGGYVDDEDHGEWFLYTGSGGKDLSGNKRTNTKHSFDQKFAYSNEALRLSCKMGYPVRVLRSDKEVTAYAPAVGLRYDGVYRIEQCWRKAGKQGFRVCRYLFVRCDNEPAPWTSDEHGDRPRPLPNITELKEATDLFVRKESPSWDFDQTEGRWKWVKSAPASRKAAKSSGPCGKRLRKSTKNKLLKEFSCQICRKMMNFPVTTPCAHNFCEACIKAKFAGISQVKERSRGGRTLRAQKNIMTCPCCSTDLSEFLQNPQVNRELKDVIEKLKKEEEPTEAETSGNSQITTESNSGKDNTDSEEETQNVVSEDEPATKKIKLDSVVATTPPVLA